MDMEQISFKPAFVERYSKLTDWETFKEISLTYLRRSIRINTLKIQISELKNRIEDVWELKPVPWCKEGFWIEHKGEEKRRDIGNLIEHSLGYIYVQEAASMIPPLVLDPKPGENVLDMCAAPGSKASQIGQYMDNRGVLIANDYTGLRLAPLGINMQRCGITNSIITQMYGQQFKGFKFDKILVDAPCSGTGTIRKSLKTLRIWNPVMVERLAATQRKLIESAFFNLRDGGTMVYSTCSLEPLEDEAVINFLIDKHNNAKLEEIELNIKRSEPVSEFEGAAYSSEVRKCLRIWPQDNDTEGFFVAKIRKI
ncbi:MAG: RsmB/NOP family class I SAM-dependent RNA methyltransferase [Nanoarchaeota archaeon]